MSYAPVRKDDIAIGKPLAWAIYDEGHHLLLQRGYVLESQSQLSALLEKNLFRRVREHFDAPPRRPARPPEEAPPPTESPQQQCGLDDIKLQIGDTLQLQTQLELTPARYYVKLIGYLKNGAVIVSTPVADGKLLLIRDGQAFVVRAFSGKSAFAFTAHVLKSVSAPFPHIYLSYPKSVRGLVVRRGARVNTRIIASVAAEGARTDDATAATIANLSTSGALLQAKTRLGGKGDRLVLKFRLVLNEIESYLTIPAILRNVQDDPALQGESAVVNHGVEFDDIAQQDVVMLTAFVYQQLLKDAPAD